uniref:Helix-hairpin-helix DNA-binding motif class 1 domain-containing protein n=1 Tax=Caldisericum exile TaxID=693075 RepID=A0A7C4U478_9BACT
MESLDLKRLIIIGILLIIISFGLGILVGKTFFAKQVHPHPDDIVVSGIEPKPIKIKVYVTGEVKHPDVYELDTDSIVKDAIEKAGGTTEKADLIAINLAKRLSDGEQVIVPSKEQTAVNGTGNAQISGSNSAKSGKININTASKEELMNLPGIGDVKAQAIIDYRTKNGTFKDIHEIVNVSGIGEKTFEKIKDLITT